MWPGGGRATHAVCEIHPDGGVVTMSHLIRATQREYQKMGKVMLSGEFGEYERLTEAR